MNTVEVGGYTAFDLLMGTGRCQLHLESRQVHALALGRHCLEAACRSLAPKRVHAPNFICSSVTQVFENLGVPIVRYELDESLLPRQVDYQDGELMVLVNYLGLSAARPAFGEFLAQNSRCRIIIDNTHSMGMDNQFPGRMSFVSPRKFLPVPDGGILYDPACEISEACLPRAQDRSWDRVGWLFRCLDEGGRQVSYPEYVAHRDAMQSLPYSRMSNTTRCLLDQLDIHGLIQSRASNFERLARNLRIEPTFNGYAWPAGHSPIGYPVRVRHAEDAQQQLAGAGIYTIRYWPELSRRTECLTSHERLLLDSMLVLPITAPMDDANLEKIRALMH